MFQYQSQGSGLRNSILAELCRHTTEKQQFSGHVCGTPGHAQLPQRQQLRPERRRLAEARPLRSTQKMKSSESGFDAFKAWKRGRNTQHRTSNF
jgi:hypothetical protein